MSHLLVLYLLSSNADVLDVFTIGTPLAQGDARGR